VSTSEENYKIPWLLIPIGSKRRVIFVLLVPLKDQLMVKKIAILFGLLVPLALFGQDNNCFNPNGDCTLVGALEFHYDIIANCGDTVQLLPTSELCNTWSVAPGINFWYGTDLDSSTIYVVADQCFSEPFVVDGITNTPSGTGIASCDIKIAYTVLLRADTLQTDIPCADFLALDSLYETLQRACGCASLVQAYTSDLSPCIDCGTQCIFLAGTTHTTGGGTAGADIQVTYTRNGTPATATLSNWTGGVDQLVCFPSTDELTILQVNSSFPAGTSGSASVEAWVVSHPGEAVTTDLTAYTCNPAEVGMTRDTLLAASGCDSIVTTFTELYPPPALVLEDQYGCVGETVTLRAVVPTPVTYEWNTGATTATLEVLEPGQYTVTVTNIQGCQATASAEAVFSDISVALTVSVAEELLISTIPLVVWQAAAIQLDAVVSGTQLPYDIIWNGGPEVGTATFNYIVEEDGEIRVAVIDSLGCVGTAAIAFRVPPTSVFVPTAFSPNEDQINDYFNIYTSPNVAEVRLQVFSRRGSLLFDRLLQPLEQDRQGLVWEGWDGTINGKRLNAQVLVAQVWYRPIRGEWEITAGSVTLVR